MAAKRTVKTKTNVKSKRSTGTAKRLTPEEREAIAAEPTTMTLAQLADKYSTSINTIQRYRSGKVGKRRKASGMDGRSKLTDEQRAEIAADTTSTLAQLATKFGVSVPTIRKATGPRRGTARASGSQVTATGATRVVPTGSTEGITFTVEGGRINFSVAKHHPLARTILADLTK